MFSIPFGRLYRDFDERTVRIARSLSIEYIFSAYGGLNISGQPAYYLRRLPVYADQLSEGVDRIIHMLNEPYVAPEYREGEKMLYAALKEYNTPLAEDQNAP
jgi:hypothetical protein